MTPHIYWFQYTRRHGRVMDRNYLYWKNGSFKFDPHQFNLILPHFSQFPFSVFQKSTGLWLAGEVVNHVGIYGSKAAEGGSAFQRRSC